MNAIQEALNKFYNSLKKKEITDIPKTIPSTTETNMDTVPITYKQPGGKRSNRNNTKKNKSKRKKSRKMRKRNNRTKKH